MNSTEIELPRLLSGRAQIRQLLERGVDSVGNVRLLASWVRSSSPSAVDELVRTLFVDNGVSHVLILNAPSRLEHLARRASLKHGVADRLEVVARPELHEAG